MTAACCCRYFFFSSRRRHTRSLRDWSSDVCSSDLSTMKYWISKRTFIVSAIAAWAVSAAACSEKHDAGAASPHKGTEGGDVRSEERRVGKECRSGWSLNHEKKRIIDEHYD